MTKLQFTNGVREVLGLPGSDAECGGGQVFQIVCLADQYRAAGPELGAPLEAHRLMVRAARQANLPPKERERIALAQKEALSVLTPKHPVRIALEGILADMLADENTTLLTGAKLASAEELRYQAGRAAMAADVLAGLAGLWPREE